MAYLSQNQQIKNKIQDRGGDRNEKENKEDIMVYRYFMDCGGSACVDGMFFVAPDS